MEELITQNRQLPDVLDDLSRFVLVGREKLNAVRAEIRAIKKVGLAKEVHEQKLQEAQEIAEAVLDAEVKIGELTAKIEKASGARTDLKPIDSTVERSKSQALEEIGIPQRTAERFERMARYPETVEKAKADARAEGRIVTRSDVLNRIAPPKTRDQSMREFKQQAREEHKEFKEAKADGVVSIQEAKKDKENLEVIALDIETTVRKAFAAVNAIGFLKSEELRIMIDSLEPRENEDMIRLAQNSIRVLARLSRSLEEGRVK